MKNKNYWTIVHTCSQQPVAPIDYNPKSDDKGMLVYRSYQAANASAHRHRLIYFMKCQPCKLGEEK